MIGLTLWCVNCFLNCFFVKFFYSVTAERSLKILLSFIIYHHIIVIIYKLN